MIPRSYLYVPGDASDKLAKALSRGSDALILDLEDAVAPAAKDAARQAVRQWIDGLGAAAEGTEIWVRINPGAAGLADIQAVVHPSLTGVMPAKTESVGDLRVVDTALAAAETAMGMQTGRVRVVPLLESAAAVLDAREIAGGPRVVRIQLGEADLRADIGVEPGPEERELDHVRSQMVLISAAAGIEPPVGPVSTDFADLDALRASTERLARMGFVGRACIHPAQVAVVNHLFTPGAAQVARARELLAGFDRAVADGRGVMVGDDGRMVDEAVVRQARRLLATARD